MEKCRIEEVLINELSEGILFHPNPGNAGDALISVGCYDFFQKNNINYNDFWWDDVSAEEVQGKIVVLGGGGGFIPTWSFTRNFIKKYHKHAKKIILLPQTINGNEDLLMELGENTTVFVREKISYAHTNKYLLGGAKLFLSDDMAFHVNVSKALEFNKKDLNFKYSIKDKLALVTSFLAKKRNGISLNAFRNDAEKSGIVIPNDNYDVSVPFSLGTENETQCRYTAMRFLNFLGRFEKVKTNRLHVAVGAALLNKKVDFHTNSYYKCQAVYENSMEGVFENVTWKGSLDAD